MEFLLQRKICKNLYFILKYHDLILDEFKGHSLLEGARQTDLGRTKKYLEVVLFKHPYTGDTALVGCFLYRL